MLKQLIESYLIKAANLSDITWYYGREGYYILAKEPVASNILCININNLVEEILRNEGL